MRQRPDGVRGGQGTPCIELRRLASRVFAGATKAEEERTKSMSKSAEEGSRGLHDTTRSILKALQQDLGVAVRTLDVRDDDSDADAPILHTPAGASHDKYVLDSQVGEGGMGTVHKAFDTDLRRWVAMKVVRDAGGSQNEMLNRFVEEAQVCGQLQHPNVPPIYEMGLNLEGRIYFTMKLVRGKSLREIIVELREGREASRREFSSIRVAQILQQAAMAVHYANARGVVHRDLKPENIMVGDYGEVQVIDWGLAKVVGAEQAPSAARPETDDSAGSEESHVETTRSQSGEQTMVGSLQGSPLYMAPEQARGELDSLDARTDVYGLGVVLYEMLALRAAHAGETLDEVLTSVKEGVLRFPSQLAPEGREVPDELESICMKAISAFPEDRHSTALEFQQDLQAFIEGSHDRERRRKAALELVTQGERHVAAYRELQSRRRHQQEQAQGVRGTIASFDPVDKKEALWEIEDAIQRLEEEASTKFSDARALFDAAIQTDPHCSEARTVLAELYWERFLEAENRRDAQSASFYRSLVETNDPEGYSSLLKGDGKLSVESDPAGAEVTIYEYSPSRRVLAEKAFLAAGTTPLSEIDLPMGSYVLVLRREGYRDARYPVSIGRSERHRAVVRLYRDEQIGDEFEYIPAGEFVRGGDPESFGGQERDRVQVGDFFMGRYPVTVGEYCEFLDARRNAGEEVSEHLPGQGGVFYVHVGASGHHEPTPELTEGAPGEVADPTHPLKLPVFAITWHSAIAYAKWRSERDGREYELPPEEAWEKAARGVDGRFYPWGDHFDWTFVSGGLSRDSHPEPQPVGKHPTDTSPYGVRDLAGSIREWTQSLFDARAGTRVVRGGSWNLVVPRHFRCATRFGYRPDARISTFGFRLYSKEPLGS